MNERLESRIRHATRAVDQVDLGSAEPIFDRVDDRLGQRERRRRRTLVASTAVIAAVALAGVAAVSLRSAPPNEQASTSATPSRPDASTPPGSTSAPEDSATMPAATAPPSSTAAEQSRWRPVAPSPYGVGWDLAAVWLGSEAFVLGRQPYAYDPATDEWRALAPFPSSWAPDTECDLARGACPDVGVGASTQGYVAADPVVVWTGTRVIVADGDVSFTDATEDTATGCAASSCAWDSNANHAYDPTLDRWELLAPTPGPITARSPHIWTGDELLVWQWDRDSDPGNPHAYDPATDTWRELPAAPISPRQNAASVWTGSEWIIWGGGDDDQEYSDGAAFNPATNTWRTLPDTPLSRRKTTGIWTGTEMIVMAGSQGGGTSVCCGTFALSDGAAYDPRADSWRPLAGTVGHPGFEPLWTGDLLLMFAKGGVIVYDPASGASIDVCCEGLAGSTHIWTGNEAISFGSYTTDRGGGIFTPP